MLLAIEDFLPVILSGIGLILVAKTIGASNRDLAGWATLGAVLAVGGGLSKATHKLTLALGGPDVTILDEALFPLLAAGFAIVAASAWSARRPSLAPGAVALSAPLVWGAGFAARAGGMGSLLFIAIATIASLTLTGLLISWSRRVGETAAVWWLGTSLVLTVVLGGMAPTLGDAPEFQWLEQGTNTATQAAFLAGTSLLFRRVTDDS